MRSGIAIRGNVQPSLRTERPPQVWHDDDRSHYAIDTRPLQLLQIEFLEYIWERIPESAEWDSTSTFLEYLSMDVLEVRLLGCQPTVVDDPSWRLDFLFSSCGGMAEESSRLAAHWASIWFQQRRPEVCREVLLPFGFSPLESVPSFIGVPDIDLIPIQDHSCTIKCPQFAPIPGASYATFDPQRRSNEVDSSFQINLALADSLGDGCDQLLADVEASYGEALSTGKCLCQLCSPSVCLSAFRRTSQ